MSGNPKNFGVYISHEKTQAHVGVSIAFGRCKAGQRSDRVQEQAFDKEATFWRNDLLRIINTVKTLAMTSLALRGHHEHAGDSGRAPNEILSMGLRVRRHWPPFICALRGQRRGTVYEARYTMKLASFSKAYAPHLTKKHVFFHMMRTHLQTILAKSADKQTPPERDIAHF